MSVHQIDELMSMLQQGIQSILDSDQYRNYLRTMSRFPTYSARNSLLIFTQKPDATMVAGYQAWSRLFGRHVRRGEKGIRILAPYTYTVKERENGVEQKKTKTGFRSISVFDISQTEGKPLPALPSLERLCGDCPFLDQAKAILEELTGFTVSRTSLKEGMNGRCLYDEKKIEISSAVENLHAFKTLIHESGHALLHAPLSTGSALTSFEALLLEHPELREAEAESVSYVVCQAIGMDCSEYSFGYIARWFKKSELLPESLERIARVSQKIIEALSGRGISTSGNFRPTFSSGQIQASTVHSSPAPSA